MDTDGHGFHRRKQSERRAEITSDGGRGVSPDFFRQHRLDKKMRTDPVAPGTIARVSDFLAQLEQSIKNRRLFRAGQAILVAVSGGLDSMALLSALHELAPEHGW